MALTGVRVSVVIDTFRASFKRTEYKKSQIDMARTRSGCGWFRASDSTGLEVQN
ncbi:MAG: hypothetical protein ACI9KK_001270 [Ascidiaceihabitans sp.]|jgi:hypothetical protein